MTVALGPGIGIYVLPSGWFETLCETVRGGPKRISQPDVVDELESEQISKLLTQQVDAPMEYEVSNDVDEPMLPEKCDPAVDLERVSRSSSEASAGGGMRFITSYFSSSPKRERSNNGSAEDIEMEDEALVDEFEILTAADINDAIIEDDKAVSEPHIADDDNATVASASLSDEEASPTVQREPERPSTTALLAPRSSLPASTTSITNPARPPSPRSSKSVSFLETNL